MQERAVNYGLIKLVLTFGIAFAAPSAANATPSGDSVRVVKGQVSDYYIPVNVTYDISGRVTDSSGTPLEGATVMFFASPSHCNTDADGRYTLNATDELTSVYVYYPGMEFANIIRDTGQTVVDVVMRPERVEPTLREKAVATKWYDPEDCATSTYCNPLNISYNYEPYNDNVKPNGSFRSSADPMALTYGDATLLFSTNQGGFHYSKNLSDWDFAAASFQRRPTDDDQCAPAAFVSGDTLFYTGSTYEGLPVWYTTDPYNGRFLRAIERNKLPTWDPCLFLDDDGRLYEYYGSSNEFPLKAVEISRDDFRPISKIHDVVTLRPEEHGWERFGMNNDDETTLRPFTEGAYMTKHNGRYYLQYGAPGTEFKIYADGVYVGDSPLGPFTYQRHNPMSYKPGGFVQGAGHGGTWQDVNGNYWHVATCMVSLKYKFERRIGLYPVDFDQDGIMRCNTAFGDYPCWNADKAELDADSRFTGWMLLSYGKSVEVSSTADNNHPATNLSDDNIRTFWAAATGNPGEWIKMDLGGEKHVRAIQLNYYDYNSFQHNRANDLYHQYRIYASADGVDWTLVVDKSNNDRDVPHDYVELRQALSTRYLKIENLHVPTGNFCLSDLRVFGTADGDTPKQVTRFDVRRDNSDPRNAIISWQPEENAYGYNIRYGVAPHKLYHTITVNGECGYDLRGLDRDTTYYFAIEALGEAGVSELSEVIER